MVLIFEEVLGPRTGRAADADPARRHAVRLTKVEKGSDPLGGRFLDPPNDGAVDVTTIAWATADALPFPLCISAQLDGGEYLDEVSVARGNIVLADHGVTLFDEPLDPVPYPDLRLSPPSSGCDRCETCEPVVTPARYRPSLAAGPVTQAATITIFEGGARRVMGFDPDAPAAAAMTWSMDQVLPAVTLQTDDGWGWSPQRDLLGSDAFARDFVVEVEDDGRAALRFGDDRNGARPAPGTRLLARYRVGNGAAGNVGAEALAHVTTTDDRIEGARNPLPAKGGVDPESVERVRQYAPSAFRVPKRAVTPEDYARFAEQHPEVQRAVATLRWTGSWRTVFITVDRLGGRPIDADFEADLRDFLEPYRMAGQDIEIDGPELVALELDLHICVAPDHFRSDVKAALLEVFGSRDLATGGRGFFHPDNFTFAQPVYLSRIYAAAQSVPGVRAVRVTKLQRLGVDDRTALDRGELTLRRLEIAQLENDPSFPERGVLRLSMEGGR
ncbi:MAG: putative baseplate assembly protein [Minicystis sp.]